MKTGGKSKTPYLDPVYRHERNLINRLICSDRKKPGPFKPLDSSRLSSHLDLLHLVIREFNANLEINQILHNVLSAATAAVGAADASLFLFDGQGKLTNSLWMNGFEIQTDSRTALATKVENSLVEWVRKNGRGLIIKDTRVAAPWNVDQAQPKLLKVGSLVTVPLRLPDQSIGVLTITAPHPNHFDQNHFTLLTLIANQAAFAIANAHLFNAEQQRRRLADTLASITRTINSTLDLDEVLMLILEQLRLVVDYDSSSILLYEDDDRSLAVRAARGFSDMQDALNVRITRDENSPNYRAILEKRPVVIDDVDIEPHWIKSSSSQNVRSWIGAPLIARDEVVGILTVDSHKAAKYTAENARIVASFVNQVATAVANAQAVARLQHAEATYACLFEDSADLIFITNYDGLILDINRTGCQMLRRAKEVFIGTNLTFMMPSLRAFLAQQTRRLRDGAEASIEIEVTDVDRPALPLEIKVRQVQYKGKDAVEWVGRDISARKEVERMRQDMMNMLVHDLSGPLGNLLTIIDFISVMVKNGRTIEKPQIINLLELSKRSSQTIKDLVDSILDVSWLEQAEVPLQRTMTNLSQLLQAVQDQVLPQAMAKGMELSIQPVSESAEVWLDGNLIRRVLINLVSNAIKYTPNKGHISLTTELTKEALHFAVSDDGPGISQVDQAHIFDKFSRVDYSADAPAGVGLGLAFCKLAVEAHNGTIAVESENISGKGSIFHVTIPLFKHP